MRKIWMIIYYGIARYLPKSTVPFVGKWAMELRNICAHGMFSECNGFVNLEQGAYVGSGKDIVVKAETCIGRNFICHGRKIVFEGNCIMGEDVLVQGSTHSLAIENGRSAYMATSDKSTLVVAGDNWIGARVIVLEGCKRIGYGAVIGAGAVVTKDVPDWSIVAGNPAKVIRERNCEV